MNSLVYLIKWDIIQMLRYQLVAISVILAAFYLGLFFLLRDLGNLDKLLILLIFNDPVITGYLYAGVLWLFEKNQNTLMALTVSPLAFRDYLWSKLLVIALLATGVALVMAWAAYGFVFNYFHFIASVAISTMVFSGVGYIMVVGTRSFNIFIMRSVLFFIPIAVPFLGLFGIIQGFWLYLLPSHFGIRLMEAAFGEALGGELLLAYGVGGGYLLLFATLSLKAIQKDRKQ